MRRYLEADPLAPYGFSGWVGPEPHGAMLSDAGIRRDPLIADRVVAWLEDRYARRRAGDPDALRPFLLVASFVNPHDIVLFPGWSRRSPLRPSPLDPPHVPPAPTADEDLSTKPAAQIAFREAYYSGYGPARMIERTYRRGAQRYRDLYYRLHAEVDAPIDRVRRAVTDGGSADGPDDTVLVRTADHGDLLGAHGGLHQKWFNLYDEATRVPFVIARVGARATTARTVTAPTSHVDLVPTLLSAAGVDVAATARVLAETFSEVHPLPGRDLMPVVDGGPADDDRAVYLMTRDNVLEGDTGASGLARMLKLTVECSCATAHPDPGTHRRELRGARRARRRARRCEWRGASVETRALVRRPGDVDRARRAASCRQPAWAVRCTAPTRSTTSGNSTTSPTTRWRRATGGPIPSLHELRARLRTELKQARAQAVPERNQPWPYASRRPPVSAGLVRRLLRRR